MSDVIITAERVAIRWKPRSFYLLVVVIAVLIVIGLSLWPDHIIVRLL